MNESAHTFAALRGFLRGYLHEDIAVEYGSLAAAVQEFKSHADWEEIALAAHQLHGFISGYQGESIEDVNDELTQLGCAYLFTNWDELLELEKLLYS